MTTPKKTVLIVEDDEAIRESLRELLEEEGYPVLTAENGRRALDVLNESHLPGLVLLDLMMPIMNGWQLLERLQANPTYAGLPVVVVSAAGNATQPAGSVGFIKKPVTLEALLSAVKRYCS